MVGFGLMVAQGNGQGATFFLCCEPKCEQISELSLIVEQEQKSSQTKSLMSELALRICWSQNRRSRMENRPEQKSRGDHPFFWEINMIIHVNVHLSSANMT